ncbi:hypothetical protein BU15DRAFT_18943, partial [Melanogaster broomeanus]
QAHPGRRRRAHSIAPGDHSSPAAKARRSLAPRKSILKVNAPDDADDATQSMDITRDYRAFNDTRKSLGRRVSFANHAHVRLFEIPDHNTNSTASPQSSPAAGPEDGGLRARNDENVYPGASRSRRRSSTRKSMAISEGGGEESMDMDSDDTGFSPAAFFRAGDEFAAEDEFDDENELSDGDDMDVTEAIPRNIIRKRSLSLGMSRQPLANLTIPQPSTEAHDEQQELPNELSYIEEESAQSQSFTSEGDVSQPMEFTVPVTRPPAPPSEAWLALRSVTHSGDTPYIASSDDDEGGGVQEMELTDAVSRLQAARASLDLEDAGGEEEGQHNSFTSTEDSFVDEDIGDGEDGNRTVNVTHLMRRVSLAPTADSSVDVTSVYTSQEQSREEVINQSVPDDTEQVPSTAAPADHTPRSPSDRPPVFSAPKPAAPSRKPFPSTQLSQSATVPKPLNFSFHAAVSSPASPTHSRAPSPSKAPPSP